MKLANLGLWGVVVMLTMISYANAGHGNQCCCVCGKKVCILEVSKEEEEFTCFDVESKEICIPGIQFPWSCKRNCGGVRKVCVLKEVKKEKTVCKYDWSIKTICTTCCRRHGLLHHHANVNQPKTNRDERVPFEFYAADVLEDGSDNPGPGKLGSETQSETQPIDDSGVPVSQVRYERAFDRPIVPQAALEVPSSSHVPTQAESDSRVQAAAATLQKIFHR